jgi:hypothetical protein
MKRSIQRSPFVLVLLGALLVTLHGVGAAAQTQAPAPEPGQELAQVAPLAAACGEDAPDLAVPGAVAPMLLAGVGDPTAAGGSCTTCRFNNQSCWCDPCPSVCESCPPGGVEGVCFFGTCHPICAY